MQPAFSADLLLLILNSRVPHSQRPRVDCAAPLATVALITFFESAPATSSTGPAFWSYSYAKENLPHVAEAAGSNLVLEPVDTEHLNRLVAASMYASIKRSLPYILQTQYNYTPESGPWYPHQQAAADTSAEPARVVSVIFRTAVPQKGCGRLSRL
ncbi:hypothetical protein Esti_004666 [Eimeria stiedai]